MTAYATAQDLRAESRPAVHDAGDPRALVELLDRQAEQIRILTDGLAGERKSFLAVRPSQVESALAKLEEIAHRARDLEGERLQRVMRLCRCSLREATTMRGRVLRGHVPAGLHPQFDAARDRLRAATVLLQGEIRLGQRLLQHALKAQEGVFRSLYGLSDSAAGEAAQATNAGPAITTYDRAARGTTARPIGRTSGNLVDGTI